MPMVADFRLNELLTHIRREDAAAIARLQEELQSAGEYIARLEHIITQGTTTKTETPDHVQLMEKALRETANDILAAIRQIPNLDLSDENKRLRRDYLVKKYRRCARAINLNPQEDI